MRTLVLILCALAGLAGTTAAGTWNKRNVSIPRPNGYPASYEWDPTGLTLVYDSRRRVTVGLGGGPYYHFGHLPFAEFNGTSWVNRTETTATAPSWRTGAGAAYDSRRGVTVLFGGQQYVPNEASGELWEYDGTNWTERTWTGPGPRATSRPHLCFDPFRGRTICLTESTQTDRYETWEWTGTAWDRGPDLTGADRGATAMVFDESRNRGFMYTVLRGGDTDQTVEYIPGPTASQSVWQNIPISGTPYAGFYGVSLVYDPHRQRVLRYGGRAIGGTYIFNDTIKVWDPVAVQWTSVEFMPADGRAAAGICYDRSRGVTVLYGGIRVWIENGTTVRTTEYTETWEYTNVIPGGAWLNFAWSGPQTGNQHQPWNTLSQAMQQTPANGVILVKGNSSALFNTATLRSTPVTLRAWDGPVVLGPP